MNKYTLNIICSAEDWNNLKTAILSVDFYSTEPTLTRHAPSNSKEYATFTADHQADIMRVISLLPLTAQYGII